MRALLPLLLLLVATAADAARHRRPFHPDVALNAGYDNNGGGGCTDSFCGGNCYNGHTGNDFNLGVGNDVLAGAAGTVTAAVQGCPDYGYYCSPCGGNCGNHVRIRHPDGTQSLFCHLKNGSLTVGVGAQVGCGQKIGQSASSGCSTGPHLHFGFYPGGAGRDPYDGPCSNHGGGWVDQGRFGRSPSPACENHCECNPGQIDERGCGNCGRHRRVCGGDCKWGGFGACEGQGPCGPGQQQSEPCCDCGARTRTCGGNCQWGDWGACGGPDPPGPPACGTGKPGDCAIGATRCVEGCLTCVDTVFPTPERCDARDNDCDATTDEDATELADPPPPLAAELEDLSAPGALHPGERATIWATFRNVGSAPWPASATWIGVTGPDDEASPLRDGWSAYDVATGISEEVPPGGAVTVSFPVRMPGEAVPVDTYFGVAVRGGPVMCPASGFDFAPDRLAPVEGAAVLAEDAGAPEDDAAAPAEAPSAASSSADGGCAALPTPLLLLLALRRRRRRADSP